MKSILSPPPSFCFDKNAWDISSLNEKWVKWKQSYEIYSKACEIDKKPVEIQETVHKSKLLVGLCLYKYSVLGSAEQPEGTCLSLIQSYNMISCIYKKMLTTYLIVFLKSLEKYLEYVFKGNLKDYDETFNLAKKIMKIVGLRMTLNDTKFARMGWNLLFWFNFMNVVVSVILESTNMFLMASVGTFLDLFTMMPCVGYLIVVLSKAYRIKCYRSVFENLVYEPRDMWPKGNITEEEHKIITDALGRLRLVMKVYVFCNALLANIFSVPPLISWIESRTDHEKQPILPFFYWLPFDPFVGYRYEIMFVIQTFHCFLAAGFMLSGDLLFVVFLSHITTHFSLLAIRIKKLLFVPTDDQLIKSYPLAIYSKLLAKNNDNENSHDLKEKEQMLNEEFISIIHQHRALIRLSGDVENMYTFSLLVNFLNSSIIICFCLFCCAFIEKWSEVTYKLFFVTAIMQTWMLCWYGQQLLDTSTGVAEALYNCGWYLASKKLKKSILIMIHRSQKRVYITTYGFSIISLESYSTILKTSWSYFTLLINMYKG
ncbi:odorant receptor 85b-like [Melitaea cinxia]|uniref:odorant receptor 85b-like n=1 Tax=Melitaea cinxia TaxID=113334 RepID=UPI001E273FE2|nr:odorant receptor 85b-like [Melitaea cinxia]